MSTPGTDSVSFRRLLVPVLAMAAIVLLSNVLVQYPITDWLTWGAFSYPVTYFVTDVCNRWAGPRLARRVAWAGFVTGAIASVSVALGQDDPAFGLHRFPTARRRHL
jgi:queuosine precursor transporter